MTVTSLMPGPTETEFFERASVVSHSASTKAQGRFDRLLPERVKAQMHRRMA